MISRTENVVLGLLSAWYFVAGIEYGLFFSSIYARLVDDLGAEQYFFAFAVAVFPFAGAILATGLGRVTDNQGSINQTLIIGLTCSTVGNILYCFASTGPLVVLARFISGIGNAIDGAIIGFAGRLVGPSNRASTFAKLLVVKQMGTISCPLWVLLSKKVILPYAFPTISLNVLLSSVVAIAWLILFIWVVYILYVNEIPPLIPTSPTTNTTKQVDTTLIQNTPVAPDTTTWWFILPHYINEQFVVANLAVFSCIFLQASNETLVTPFNKSYFGWGPEQNALEFMGIGICALGGYVLAKRLLTVKDGRQYLELKNVFAMGNIGCVFVCFYTAIIISFAEFQAPWLYACIGSSILIFCLTLPLSLVSSASIIARNTPDEFQSFTQSIRVASEKTAQVLAPLWVGGLIPAETTGPKGFLIMFPSIILFTITSSTLCSVWQFL